VSFILDFSCCRPCDAHKGLAFVYQTQQNITAKISQQELV